MPLRVLACALASLASLALLLALFTPGTARFSSAYGGDDVLFQCLARAVCEGQPYYAPHRLGAPDQADWRACLGNMSFEFALVRGLGRAGLDSFGALYYSWVLLVALTALTACWAFLKLNLSRATAVALAVLYALQPSAWAHNIAHFNLMFPWVPLVAASSVALVAGLWEPTGRLRGVPWWAILGCFLQGLMNLDYGFFSLWALAFVGVYSSLRRGRPAAVQAGVALLALTLGLALHLAPVLDNPATHPGMRDRLGLSWFGLVGSLGLVSAAVLLVLVAIRRAPCWARPIALAAAGLLACTFSLGTWGGPYYRVVVFGDFYALLVLGVAARASRFEARRWWPWALVLVTLLGSLDQRRGPQVPYRDRRQAFEQDRDFVRLLESRLPPQSMIYQLPATPDGPGPGAMVAYDHARPYLHSRQLRWSWEYPIPPAASWQRWMAGLPPAEMLPELRRRGFRAVWLDRAGSDSLVADFEKLLGEADFIDPRRRFYVYDLNRGSRPRPLTSTPPLDAATAALVSLRVLDVPAQVRCGETFPVQVEIVNRSPLALASNLPHIVDLGYHWVASNGQTRVHDGNRTMLPTIKPDTRLVMWADVLAPSQAGQFRLRMRLVQEHVRWFEGEGVPTPPDCEVLVTP